MVNSIQLFTACIIKVAIGNSFLVKINGFIRSKNHWRAVFQHPTVHKCFNDQLNADAI